MTERKRPRKTEASFDLGFGGLFKGLGDFLDLLSQVVEASEEEVTRSDEGITRSGKFRVKGLGQQAQGVYGFSIRAGIGGIPKVDHFGNIRTTDEGPIVAEVREPLVDTFDEEEEIVIVAELPGVDEDEIRVEIQDDILSLETTGDRKYAKEILLPKAVDATTLQKTYKNGILELRLRKA